MASETSRKAERVFCQHVLKPLPDELEAYRCQRCGPVGDMRGESIVWRENHLDFVRQIVARVRRRTGRMQREYLVLLSVICLAAVIIVAAVSRAGTLHMTPGDVKAELQPIPLDEVPDGDDGCCGSTGDPQGMFLCIVCADVEISPGVTVQRCWQAVCDEANGREVCEITEYTDDAGRTAYEVKCVPTRWKYRRTNRWVI